MECRDVPDKRHKKVFFTHIPRTGGRFILYNLKSEKFSFFTFNPSFNFMWKK